MFGTKSQKKTFFLHLPLHTCYQLGCYFDGEPPGLSQPNLTERFYRGICLKPKLCSYCPILRHCVSQPNLTERCLETNLLETKIVQLHPCAMHNHPLCGHFVELSLCNGESLAGPGCFCWKLNWTIFDHLGNTGGHCETLINSFSVPFGS